MSDGGQDQFKWMQNGEPSGLYCADETDGEALRVCEQIDESLLAYKIGGTEVEPALAEECEPNDDLTEWTFTLRDGVKFHDGRTFDANDVVATYRAQWDAEDPAPRRPRGYFTYFSALFGGFLNPPPATRARAAGDADAGAGASAGPRFTLSMLRFIARRLVCSIPVLFGIVWSPSSSAGSSRATRAGRRSGAGHRRGL